METETLTLEVLRGIQSTLTGVRADRAGTNHRLERLEQTAGKLVRHQIATREAIDLLRTQAVMASHALTAQMEALRPRG